MAKRRARRARVQLLNESNSVLEEVDVITASDCVLFSDGKTLQQKLESDELRGKTGSAPKLTIGTVNTLDAGKIATVEISGTEDKPVLNFGIPRGEGLTEALGGFDPCDYYKKKKVDELLDELEKKIPTKTSQIENDNDFLTKDDFPPDFGLVPDLQPGDIELIEPGEQPSITRRGSNAMPIFDFKLPMGGAGGGRGANVGLYCGVNKKNINVMSTEVTGIDLGYMVTEMTNLVMSVSLFPNVMRKGNITVKMIIDSISVLDFSPEIYFEEGGRNASFTIPLLRVSPDRKHNIAIKLKGDEEGAFKFTPGSIQVVIFGQGVAGESTEFPHYEAKEFFETSLLPKPIVAIKQDDPKLTFKEPNKNTYSEKITKEQAKFNVINNLQQHDKGMTVKFVRYGYHPFLVPYIFKFNKDIVKFEKDKLIIPNTKNTYTFDKVKYTLGESEMEIFEMDLDLPNYISSVEEVEVI